MESPLGSSSVATSLGIWSLNIAGAVGIILVNKQLMSAYGFQWVTTLTGLHFAVTAVVGQILTVAGVITSRHSVPPLQLAAFAVLGNVSLVATNFSLLLNSVGFYQICKVSIIPIVCLFESLAWRRAISPRVRASMAVVMVGVGLCTNAEISLNLTGFLVAAAAVLCSALHMMLIGWLQQTHSVSPFDLLSQTAPIQASLLLLVGPSLDYVITHRPIETFECSAAALAFLLGSCALAAVCNLSVYLCIGRFSATSYQVLGHVKTVLVLLMGALLFSSPVTAKGVLGACLTVLGMALYGRATLRDKEEDKDDGLAKQALLSVAVTKGAGEGKRAEDV